MTVSEPKTDFEKKGYRLNWTGVMVSDIYETNETIWFPISKWSFNERVICFKLIRHMNDSEIQVELEIGYVWGLVASWPLIPDRLLKWNIFAIRSIT